MATKPILSRATSVSSGTAVQKSVDFSGDFTKSFHASLNGTGALTATVIIEVSNDGVLWNSDADGTMSLSGTTSATSGCSLVTSWQFIRARISAITGTSATVDVVMGF